MSSQETRDSAAHSPMDVATSERVEEAVRALRNGPTGAFILAGIAVGLLFIAWLLFYFLLFMPRGAIG